MVGFASLATLVSLASKGIQKSVRTTFGRKAIKLYYFPSPNPQKVRFALLELGLECEIIPVDLIKSEQRTPEFLALNPYSRVPVLTDGALTLWESHAILAYLGEKTGKLWPTSAGGRAGA